jgi:hypothetical protein
LFYILGKIEDEKSISKRAAVIERFFKIVMRNEEFRSDPLLVSFLSTVDKKQFNTHLQ